VKGGWRDGWIDIDRYDCTEQAGVAATPRTRIQEVLISNIGQDPKYIERPFVVPYIHPAKYKDHDIIRS
jgi:hypothetical protein